jgi:hypothetical protein
VPLWHAAVVVVACAITVAIAAIGGCGARIPTQCCTLLRNTAQERRRWGAQWAPQLTTGPPPCHGMWWRVAVARCRHFVGWSCVTRVSHGVGVMQSCATPGVPASTPGLHPHSGVWWRAAVVRCCRWCGGWSHACAVCRQITR